MAHSNDYVVAIDLGTTKVVTMVGKMNSNGKLQVVGLSTAESTGIKRGMIQNIEETVKAIQKTVDDVKKQVGLEFHSAYVGIAGQHIRSIKNSNYLNFDTDDREISQDDIDRLVKDMNLTPVDAGETILHVLPLEFFVDKEPVDNNRPVGMMGRRLDANFHIVIGKTSSAKHIEKCVNRVGLSVADLILEPLASAEAVLTDDEREAGVALIDIGGGTTDLAIYYEGNIRHTAVIPFGGNVITQDISVKNLAGIIQARMEEILDFVLYEINLSGYAEKLSAGVVITGGGALLKHLSHLIKFKSGYDVRLGFPSEKLSSDSLEKYNHPQLSTALGLALIGLERQTATPVQDDAKQQNATEPSVDKEFSEVHEKKGSKFNAIKQMISGLFEETDSEM